MRFETAHVVALGSSAIEAVLRREARKALGVNGDWDVDVSLKVDRRGFVSATIIAQHAQGGCDSDDSD